MTGWKPIPLAQIQLTARRILPPIPLAQEIDSRHEELIAYNSAVWRRNLPCTARSLIAIVVGRAPPRADLASRDRRDPVAQFREGLAVAPQPVQRHLSWWMEFAGPIGATALLLAGCVDAPPETTADPLTVIESPAVPSQFEPDPAEAPTIILPSGETPPLEPTPVEPTPVKSDPAEPRHIEPTSGEPTPIALKSTPAKPNPLPATVKRPSEPTPLVTAAKEPTPTPTSLVPPALGPIPELEPTLAEPTPVATATQPAIEPPKKPAMTIGEREPLPAKPRQIIVFSPKRIDASTATPITNAKGSTPVVILPPSSGASLAPLETPEVKLPTPIPMPVAAISKPLVPNLPASPAEMKPSLTPEPEPSAQPASKPSGVPTKTVSLTKTTENIPEGFVALFNGHDLSGWDVFDGKTAAWQATEGEIRCTAPGGGWLQTIDTYSDFELRFEYRLSPGCNSGVSLRFPGQGNPSLQGLEIQLLDDKAEKYLGISPTQATGSLYFAAAPSRTDVAKPSGEWNQCVIECRGTQVTVAINGETVNTIDLEAVGEKATAGGQSAASLRSPTGVIALQSHSTRVDFRQVMVKDLTQALPSGVRWLDLVEGTGEVVPAGAKITVHYIGHVTTGKRFGNSYDKGKPSTISLGEVIPGWREGIPGMKVGGKRRLIVPASLAYGSKGYRDVIPPDATLVYQIELVALDGAAAAPVPPPALPVSLPSENTPPLKPLLVPITP